MGLLQFKLPQPTVLPQNFAELAYLASLDRIPWKSEVELVGELLRFQRPGQNSVSVTTPWLVAENRMLAMTSGTLLERKAPYDLATELARGKIGQLLDQLYTWQELGLAVPADLASAVNNVLRAFRSAVFSPRDSDRRQALLCETLDTAVQIGGELARIYTSQALEVRRLASRGRIGFLLGPTLGEAEPGGAVTDTLLRFSTAVQTRFNWGHGEPTPRDYCFDIPDRQLLWSKQTRLIRAIGPLISLDSHDLPSWIQPDTPFPLIEASALNFICQVVRRYRARMDFWEIVGPLNAPLPFAVSDEKLASFVARALQTARNLDPGATIALSVRQPWLEDLRFRECEYPAPLIVDALLRAEIGIDGIVLEFYLGYAPDGTYPRDLLELSRQIEFWSQWGVPLFIRFCAPSRPGGDPLCVRSVKTLQWPWNEEEQLRWTEKHLRMFLSNPLIRGVFWSPWCDFEPHEFPYGGLFDLSQKPKPVTEFLADLRQEWIG